MCHQLQLIPEFGTEPVWKALGDKGAVGKVSPGTGWAVTVVSLKEFVDFPQNSNSPKIYQNENFD